MSGVRMGRVVLAVTLGLVGAVLAPVRAGAVGSAGFHFVAPAVRVLDTRSNPGVKLAGGVERMVALTTAVPTGATSVAVVIQTSDATASGLVRIYRCGADDPTVLPVLVVDPGASVANRVRVPITARQLCVTSSVAANMVIDVVGYDDGTGTLAYRTATPRVVLDASLPAGDTVAVAVTGADVPADTVGVAVLVEGAGLVGGGSVTVYPCGAPRPATGSFTFDFGTISLIAPTGTNGTVCVYTSAAIVLQVTVVGFWQTGAIPTPTGPPEYRYRPGRYPGLTATVPTRVLDTRTNPTGTPLAAGAVYRLDLTGRIPPDTTDVVMNVTVTSPTGPGFITAYPCAAGTRPTASNLNYTAGQTIANLATIAVGPDLTVCLYTLAAAHVVVDLAGWYQPDNGAGFSPTDPTRLFDTRTLNTPLATGATYTLDLTGRIPNDTTAVVMNVTATEPTGPGYLTTYPCASPRPTASNLNYIAGQTIANLTTVTIGTDHTICFYAQTGTHLLADLAGTYSPTAPGGYLGAEPCREFDTRTDNTTLPTAGTHTLSFAHDPAGCTLLPPELITAAVVNITAVNPTGPGFITAYPCASGKPTASNLNYNTGQIIPNLAIVKTDPTATICFYTHQHTDLIADTAGYFTNQPLYTPTLIT